MSQPRKSVLLNAALSGYVLFSPSSVLIGTGPPYRLSSGIGTSSHNLVQQGVPACAAKDGKHFRGPDGSKATPMDRCNRPGNVWKYIAEAHKKLHKGTWALCPNKQLLDEDLQSAKLLTLHMAIFIHGRHRQQQHQHGHVCKVNGAK